jgi:hypothetical protein
MKPGHRGEHHLQELHPVVSPLDMRVLMQHDLIELIVCELTQQIVSDPDLGPRQAEYRDTLDVV